MKDHRDLKEIKMKKTKMVELVSVLEKQIP